MEQAKQQVGIRKLIVQDRKQLSCVVAQERR
jgi:hypothetical protein